MPPRPLNIKFPAGGLVRSLGYQDQPPFTTPDCCNVRPRESLGERTRGGSRPGVVKAFSQHLGVLVDTTVATSAPSYSSTTNKTTVISAATSFIDLHIGMKLDVKDAGQFIITDVDGISQVKVQGNCENTRAGVPVAVGDQIKVVAGGVNMLTSMRILSERSENQWTDEFVRGPTSSLISDENWPWIILNDEEADLESDLSLTYDASVASTTSSFDTCESDPEGDIRMSMVPNLQIDTLADYQVDLWVTKDNGLFVGKYGILGNLDKSELELLENGFWAEFDLHQGDNTNQISVKFRHWIGGTEQTESDRTLDYDTSTLPDTVKLTVKFVAQDGAADDVQFFIDDVQIGADVTKDAATIDANTAIGFSLRTVDTGFSRVARASRFQCSYFGGGDRTTSRRVTACAGGRFYVESADGELAHYENTTSTAKYAFGNRMPIQAAEYEGKLYIAEHEAVYSSSSGDLNGTSLTEPGISDFADVIQGTASPAGYRVEFPNGEYSNIVVDSFSTNTINFGSSVGTDDPIAYRIVPRPKIYDPDGGSDKISLWEAGVTGTLPEACPIIGVYNNRMVLAGDPPQIWHMSKQGDPLNWSYGTTTEQDAVAATNDEQSSMPNAVTAIIAGAEDYLMMASPDSTFVFRGDPQFQSELNSLDRRVGVVGKFAYAYGPQGNVYILSRDGIYLLPGSGRSAPRKLSRRVLPRELRNVDPLSSAVHMEYDIPGQGMHLSVANLDSTGGSFWWIDMQNPDRATFWPVTYGNTDFEPLTSHAYEADIASNAHTIFGCRDGYVRRYDEGAIRDDYTDFDSFIYFGPFEPGGHESMDGIVWSLEGILDENSGDVTAEVFAGDNAQEAFDLSTADYSSTWSAGRNVIDHSRVYGNSAFVKVKTGESISVTGTAVTVTGQNVVASGSPFNPDMQGGTITFDTSGTTYNIIAVASPTFLVVSVNADVESDTDTFVVNYSRRTRWAIESFIMSILPGARFRLS